MLKDTQGAWPICLELNQNTLDKQIYDLVSTLLLSVLDTWTKDLMDHKTKDLNPMTAYKCTIIYVAWTSVSSPYISNQLYDSSDIHRKAIQYKIKFEVWRA